MKENRSKFWVTYICKQVEEFGIEINHFIKVPLCFKLKFNRTKMSQNKTAKFSAQFVSIDQLTCICFLPKKTFRAKTAFDIFQKESYNFS